MFGKSVDEVRRPSRCRLSYLSRKQFNPLDRERLVGAFWLALLPGRFQRRLARAATIHSVHDLVVVIRRRFSSAADRALVLNEACSMDRGIQGQYLYINPKQRVVFTSRCRLRFLTNRRGPELTIQSPARQRQTRSSASIATTSSAWPMTSATFPITSPLSLSSCTRCSSAKPPRKTPGTTEDRPKPLRSGDRSFPFISEDGAPFSEAMREGADTPFYRSIANLTERFVASERA